MCVCVYTSHAVMIYDSKAQIKKYVKYMLNVQYHLFLIESQMERYFGSNSISREKVYNA